MEIENKTKILFIGFNQDFECINVGTNIGFRIYKTDPFELLLEKSI